MIDLHSHSTASDGTFTACELIKYAKSKNLKGLAITDHDTCAGLKEGQAQAKKEGLIFIPGIEISIQWPTGEFHLLGLGLQKLSPGLEKICAAREKARKIRNLTIAEKLNQSGIKISLEELESKFNTKNIGRPHFAQLMVEKGYVKHRQDAFDRYFAKGRPCFVNMEGADLEEACLAIRTSGGIPVQAHPLSMYVSWGKMEDTIKLVVSKGVMGLEAWHPGVRVAEAMRLEGLSKKLGLICTGGSDFHGEKVRADRKLGYTAGKKQLDDHFYEEELLPLWQKVSGKEKMHFE